MDARDALLKSLLEWSRERRARSWTGGTSFRRLGPPEASFRSFSPKAFAKSLLTESPVS